MSLGVKYIYDTKGKNNKKSKYRLIIYVIVVFFIFLFIFGFLSKDLEWIVNRIMKKVSRLMALLVPMTWWEGRVDQYILCYHNSPCACNNNGCLQNISITHRFWWLSRNS